MIFVVASLCAAVWILFAAGGLDREGTPIGADFISFWTASRLALEGRPVLAWDAAAHWAAEKALFGAAQGYVAFFYPPPYLLICLPLALAPYFWSLAVWLGASGYAFFRVARGFLPGLDPVALLAFPAVFINAANGQNGFLSAALVGGGFLLMDRRPALAGLCFGAMAFKPQLVLMLPLALLFARRWTTFALAAAAAAAFCWLSCFAFGARAWSGFFADSALARAALEQNLIGYEKMQSVFAAVRLLHGPLGLAYGLQGLAALAAAATLFALEQRAFRGPAEAPAAICASLVSTPFLLDYDLTLLFVPLAWLTAEGLRRLPALRESGPRRRLSAAGHFTACRGRSGPAARPVDGRRDFHARRAPFARRDGRLRRASNRPSGWPFPRPRRRLTWSIEPYALRWDGRAQSPLARGCGKFPVRAIFAENHPCSAE